MFSRKPVDIIRDGLILIGAVTAYGYIAKPDNPFLTGISVHPYFIIVLLMAIRYGTIVGIGSATTLVLLYICGGLAQPGELSVLPSILESPHSTIVSGLFLFAVIAGSFADAYQRRIKYAEAEIMDDKKRLRTLEKQNGLLIKTNQDLRNRIMEETTTFHTIFEISRKLCTLNGQTPYSTVTNILVEYLKAESCSFYLLQGELLHLMAYNGQEAVPEQDKMITIGHCPIIEAAIKEKRLVSLKDFVYRDDIFFRNRVMAAPVCSQTDGKVMGVISIEKIPFDLFNPQTMRIFSLIANWASKTVANHAHALLKHDLGNN